MNKIIVQTESEKGTLILTMPYRQYKNHYRDCKTVDNSYNPTNKTISVILTKGRLKNSGVRGKHFVGYQLKNEEGEVVTYRAVSKENALKRAQKEFPEHTWACVHVFS